MRKFETCGSLARLSAGGQGLSAPLARLRLPKEFGNVHVERSGELVQIGDRGVLDAPFDPPDIGPIDTSINGELLLRDARPDPYLSQVPRDKRFPVHP